MIVELTVTLKEQIEHQAEFDRKRGITTARRKVAVGATNRPFEQLHFHVVGYWQFDCQKRWIVTVIDNYSSWAYHCLTSLDAAEFMRDFIRQTGTTPARIVCENRTQFSGAEFVKVVAEIKAQLIFVGTYAHWAAGKIERWHRVLNERTRAAIFDI